MRLQKSKVKKGVLNFLGKIWACLNVFNEKDALKAAVESCDPYVDGYIFVDGAYAGFPNHGNNGASNDGTLELIKSMITERTGKECKLIESPGRPWMTEMEKRTAYCNAVPEGDWIFIIDADERILYGGDYLTSLDAICETRYFEAGIVIIKSSSYGTMPRVFKKLRGMHYEAGHSHIIHDGEFGHRWKELWLPLIIEEKHEARGKQRDAERLAYYASGLMK